MKKTICLLISLCFCVLPVRAEEKIDLAPNASAFYLMEYESGKVIDSKNAEERYYPASMTKMMSLLLVYEQLNSGALSWNDEVVASSHAASMGGSQIFLEENEVMTVEELVKSSALASANDAITALAEKVAGSETIFVSMMNQKASDLGCVNTHFVNPTGLHDEQHYSCAKDMALIAQALIREGNKELFKYTSRYEDYIRENTDQKFWLVNTNKLIRTYQGMDGLKTGYTSQSMYCITVTAERNGLRFIVVVMNEPTKDKRNKEASALLDYGFANYKSVMDYEKGTTITELAMLKGKPERVELVLNESISHVEKNAEPISIVKTNYTIENNKAPLRIGDHIGTLTLIYSDGSTKTASLTVKNPVEVLDYLDIVCQLLKMTFFS